MSGRVTKNDILSFIESGAAMSPQEAMQTPSASAASDAASARTTGSGSVAARRA
jgi:hypothetical protein